MAGTIIILNGTSSSGKTSIANALQNILSDPYLEAGLDKFIWMLPHRYLDRPYWNEVLGLATQAGILGQRLISGMHQAIYALAKAGNNVIADHVLVESAWVQECTNLFSELPAYLIAVRCPLEVLEEREKGRRNRTLGQAKAQYPLVHAHDWYDFEVDTSSFGPAECALQIKEFIQSGTPPKAFRQLKQVGAG